MAAALVGVSLAGLGAGCQRARPVTDEECGRLLDRYTEQLARLDRPRLTSVEVHHLQAETRARAMQQRAFRACTSEVSREQMDCALATYSVDEIERCLIPMP